jgi:excinuclease UvrABC nuclease subunit
VPDCEVVTVLSREGVAVVNHFRVQERTLVATRSLVIRPRYGEDEAQLLEAALSQLAAEDADFGTRVLSNLPLPEASDVADRFRITVPLRGGERKLVERAKGLLMDRRGLSEEAAYRLLRQTAMHQHKRLGDVAEAVLQMGPLIDGL